MPRTQNFTNEVESLKKELKIKFSGAFSGGLDRCNNMKDRLQLKESVQSVFKKKRNVSSASLKEIDDELDRLEKNRCFI